ncbi:MAG: VWA domain-containing protein [Myxococcales bacterium]|nr:VWA domain-containing protein [Myxococcales bacterium]
MSFVTALALLIGLLAAAPYMAHRLRRRRGEERPFAATHLVPPAPPRARRRAELEDVALLVIRALAVLALAALGASPLVRCSRLSLTRSSGASVALAIVIDDSMSMRAAAGSGSRFDAAKRAALELLASSREGDAVAVVQAGAPPRVALAATGDIGAARTIFENMSPSDRATDLEGAVAVARGLVAQLPQVDRRVVLLSDLADGQPSASPLEGGDVPLWVPLPELAVAAVDCAVLSADRLRGVIRVRIQCSPDAPLALERRTLEVVRDGKVVTSVVPLLGVVDVAVADDIVPRLVVRLTGTDAVASDDQAPVVVEAATSAVAVVVERGSEALPTGGAPAVEQALASLKLDLSARPLPVVPDRIEDLSGFVGILVDDPPGFTPDQRRALKAFVEEGGVILVSLGPRAAAAPLGSSFEPFFERGVIWEKNKSAGADPKGARGMFVEAATSFTDLGAKERSVMTPADRERYETLVPWTDGAPLLAKRTIARGEVWLMTLPLSVDASDLPLRPGFLPLLDTWVDLARARVSDRRTPVGEPWVFVTGGKAAEVSGPRGPVKVVREGNVARAVPEVAGAYELTFAGGRKEQRVGAPIAKELDLRPRRATAPNTEAKLGDTKATVDVSWMVALVLLGLLSAELALRAAANQKRPAA